MSGKLDKFKQIFDMVEPLAKPFVPDGVGSILDKVNAGLNNGGINGPLPDAIKHLADDNDQQTQAIFAMSQMLADLRARIEKIEAR